VPTLLSWTGGRGQFRQMRGGRDRWSSGGPAEERQALAAFSSWLQQASRRKTALDLPVADRRSLEQRRTSGGKGTEYRLPKCGNAFSNHNYFPRRCNAELAPPASPGKKCWHVRRSNELGGEFGITPRRLRVSLPAPSPGVLKVEFPCLSSAGPPLLLLGICVSYYLSGGAVFSFGIQ